MIQVPFRLTRMLVKAMEVSGIEGNFRSTCENVMQVLRANKDSVMAMMEVKKTTSFCCRHHFFPPKARVMGIHVGVSNKVQCTTLKNLIV